MEHIDEIFGQPQKEFIQHLGIPDNSRIIFSGIFGIGKSHFLKKFFERSDEYEVINLYPVNYSVASNEDIFEYIKYDIFFQLLGRENVIFEELDLKFSQQFYLYLYKNWDKVAGNVFSILASLGKPLDLQLSIFEKVISFLNKTKSAVDKEYLQLKETLDETKVLQIFLESIHGKWGSLYDQGLVISIVHKKILGLNKDKKTVLVIDDVDRMDPEHIFRILNIFAAHFDATHEDMRANKFGFTKIIIVCDLENIRKMFHYKYGPEVDFNGYINKYFSNEVFHFDPVPSITGYLEQLYNVYEFQNGINQSKMWLSTDQYFHFFIKELLEKSLLNFRSLVKFCGNKHQLNPEIIILRNGGKLDVHHIPLLWSFVLIKQIIGDRFLFLSTMEKVKVTNLVVGDFSAEKLFKELLLLRTEKEHQFHKISNAPLYYVLPGGGRISYTTAGDRDRIHISSVSQAAPESLYLDPHYRDQLHTLYVDTLRHLVDVSIIR